MRGSQADKTFGGQSTHILPVVGQKDAFIFIADKWNPKDLKDSRYLWLPVKFENNLPVVTWIDSWDLAVWKK